MQRFNLVYLHKEQIVCLVGESYLHKLRQPLSSFTKNDIRDEASNWDSVVKSTDSEFGF